MGKHIEKDMDMTMDHEALGALFELSRDAVVGISENKIVFANPAADELFGLHAGDDASELFPPELLDSGRAAATLSVNGRAAELSIQRADGLSLVCLHPTAQDPSDEMLVAQLRTVRNFADSLMTLRMALDALLKRCRTDGDPRMADYAAILYREYFRLRRLCSHISTAENLARGALACSFTPLDLEQAVGELVESAAALSDTFGVDIAYRCERGDYATAADRELVETLLLNLLSNSLLHTPRGGHIRVGLRRSGRVFILSVDDDGSGMKAADLAGALEGDRPIDLTDSASGAGLGLLIAKGIAEKHGGTLIIESGENNGCRVRVSLPHKQSEETMLHHADPAYEVRDMNGILTELSPVLPTSYYQEKFFD